MRAMMLPLILVLFALPARAQDVAIKGPAKVEPYRLARLSLEGPTVENAVWLVSGAGAQEAEPAIDMVPEDGSGPTLAFSAPPGKYRVVAVVLVEGKQRRTKEFVVQFGAPPPAPGPPGPGPVDPPPPGPDDPLVGEGRVYTRGYAAMLNEVADWLAANPTATKDDVLKQIGPKRDIVAARLGRALDTAMGLYLDAAGRFKDAAGAAKLLKSVAKGVASP